MSYLDNKMTKEEFISTRGAIETQHQARNALRLLDYFCNAVHNKDGSKRMGYWNCTYSDKRWMDTFCIDTLCS